MEDTSSTCNEFMDNNTSKINELKEKKDILEKQLSEHIEEYYDIDDEDVNDDYENSPQFVIDQISDEIDKIEDKINELDYINEKEHYHNEYKKKIPNYSRGKLTPDISKTVDLFERRERAKIIARYISDKTTKTPFNIGVFSKWGEGKSTFLSFLQEEINRFNEENSHDQFRISVINYDASEYEEKNKIWASILKSMFQKYEDSVYFPKTRFNLYKIINEKRKYLWGLLSFLLSLLIVSCLSLYSIQSFIHHYNNQWSILTGSGASIVAIIVMISKLVIPFIKSLIQSTFPLSEKIINNISLPNYINKLGERENIKRDFSILVNAWINFPLGKDERLVLIVDELDRCSEKGLVEFFHSMQLFLNISNLVVVFAVDQDYLKKALVNSFNINNEINHEDFLLDYLDKYISIPIKLDTKLKYNNYINFLIDNCQESNMNFTLSDGEKEILLSAIETIPYTLLTPRKVKKMINILILSKDTCVIINNRRLDKEIIDFGGYILWFVFTYFYRNDSIRLLNYISSYSEYYTFGKILSKDHGELKDGIIKTINNPQIIELLKSLRLIDLKQYDQILSGLSKII